MHVIDEDNSEFGGWDRGFTKRLIDTARPIGKRCMDEIRHGPAGRTSGRPQIVVVAGPRFLAELLTA